MKLLWIKYNQKPLMILQLWITSGKLCAIKVFDKRLLLSDNAIAKIRANMLKWEKSKPPQVLQELKSIIPNFNDLYRTYDISKCTIMRRFDVIAI